MIYIITYQQKTFQLKILFLKFIKLFILLDFEYQNVARIKQQKFTLLSIKRILFQ